MFSQCWAIPIAWCFDRCQNGMQVGERHSGTDCYGAIQWYLVQFLYSGDVDVHVVRPIVFVYTYTIEVFKSNINIAKTWLRFHEGTQRTCSSVSSYKSVFDVIVKGTEKTSHLIERDWAVPIAELVHFFRFNCLVDASSCAGCTRLWARLFALQIFPEILQSHYKLLWKKKIIF